MHFVVNAGCFALVGIMSFGCKDEVLSEGWVTKQRSDTLDNVATIDLVDESSDSDFFTNKMWSTW
jgi:hypothetical protein